MLTVDVNIFINEYKTNSATLKNKQIISKTNKRLINLAYVRTDVKHYAYKYAYTKITQTIEGPYN